MAALRRGSVFIFWYFCTVGWSMFLLPIASGAIEEYVDQYLSSPEICKPVSAIKQISNLFIAKERIPIENYRNKTLLIKLARMQGSNSGFALYNFRCRFQITAPKGYAIMVAVRSLSLRRRLDSGNNVECVDFVKFKRDGAYTSPEICGRVEASDKNKEPSDLIGPRNFHDYTGAMDVVFSSASENSDSENTPISLELVFTAYKQCSTRSSSNLEFKCSDDACIPSTLACDGVVNCALSTSTFGKDEENCPDTPKEYSKTKTFFIFGMTAIGTLLVVVVFVLTTCCCLRRLNAWKCPSNQTQQQSSLNSDEDFSLRCQTRTTTPPTSPTAPPAHLTDAEWISAVPTAPKFDDLPPPYKDLFPDSRIPAKL